MGSILCKVTSEMQFEFESECGLKVIHTQGGMCCVLSEIDALVHGCPAYYCHLDARNHDPTSAIHEAGWSKYKYGQYEWNQSGKQALAQLTDHFGVCLYLCTIPEGKALRRKVVYQKVCETLEVSGDAPYQLLEQVCVSLLSLLLTFVPEKLVGIPPS